MEVTLAPHSRVHSGSLDVDGVTQEFHADEQKTFSVNEGPAPLFNHTKGPSLGPQTGICTKWERLQGQLHKGPCKNIIDPLCEGKKTGSRRWRTLIGITLKTWKLRACQRWTSNRGANVSSFVTKGFLPIIGRLIWSKRPSFKRPSQNQLLVN